MKFARRSRCPDATPDSHSAALVPLSGETSLPGDSSTRHGMGRIEGRAPGPLVVIVAGMHGNEPAGMQALKNVLGKLVTIEVRGTLIALQGNVKACEVEERLVDADFNRLWAHARIERVRSIEKSACTFSEERELWEMVRDIDRIFADAPEATSAETSPIFIDIHTASAPSVPFAIGRNNLDHASLFRGLPVPIIAGLEERLEGLLLQHVLDRGARTLAVETGPHEGEHAVEQLEAVLWCLLVQAGMIERDAVPGGEGPRELLRKLSRGIPPIVEVIHRHEVQARSEFEVEEGLESFDKVAANQLLAIDHGREVRAPRRCRLLMPLRQEKGEDGFFLGLDRDRLYLLLSEWFRRLHLEWLIGMFPSVRREPGLADAWRVDRSDRRYVREALRFFGYRNQVELRSGAILASRRRR